MQLAQLEALQGAVVLIESAADHHTPPTGVRGFINIVRGENEAPRVQLVADFPQMFGTKAHRRTISLTDADVSRLLASERNGSFEFVLEGPVDPAAENVPPPVRPIS